MKFSNLKLVNKKQKKYENIVLKDSLGNQVEFVDKPFTSLGEKLAFEQCLITSPEFDEAKTEYQIVFLEYSERLKDQMEKNLKSFLESLSETECKILSALNLKKIDLENQQQKASFLLGDFKALIAEANLNNITLAKFDEIEISNIESFPEPLASYRFANEVRNIPPNYRTIVKNYNKELTLFNLDLSVQYIALAFNLRSPKEPNSTEIKVIPDSEKVTVLDVKNADIGIDLASQIVSLVQDWYSEDLSENKKEKPKQIESAKKQAKKN